MLETSVNFLLGTLWLSATAQADTFEQLAQRCAPNVHPTTLQKIVSVESAHNPFAIGVVGGSVRQPKNLIDAVATARRLEQQGYNFSLGLAQINRYNLKRHGETYQSIFNPCRNLKTSAAILGDCYTRAQQQYAHPQQALRAALSCYYSGNFTRGFKREPNGSSYVERVVQAKPNPQRVMSSVPAVEEGTATPENTITLARKQKAQPTRAPVTAKNSDAETISVPNKTPDWINQYAAPTATTPTTPFVTFY